ncbi:MAG TPA: 4a-hydroxytetrahydrobiopterin dehydratase [Candidatus Hydrogenedentes bacterium]|nr:4a-hydroxytetrahydrobiopterin dehydratase [Candidatus Hydrogenedentota bacterium]
MTLAQEKCEPCHVGGTPLAPDEAHALAARIPEWILSETKIERVFKCKDFREAMVFVNKVADMAEENDHHPDIHIDYGRVTLTLWTKKIGGLSRNDFVLAAKIDQMAAGHPQA